MSARFLDQTIAWIVAMMAAAGVVSIAIIGLRHTAKKRDAAEVALMTSAAAKQADESAAARDSKDEPAEPEASGSQPARNARPATDQRAPRGELWSYSGSTGPDAWADIDPAWKLCGSGKAQSPIDIVDARINARLKPVKFTYRRSSAEFSRVGDSFVATIEHGNYVEIDGDRFNLVSISFHTPSEHLLNGLPWEMEVQLHHRSTTGELASIAFLGAPGKSPEAVSQLIASLPRETGDERPVSGVQMRSLIPERANYFHYVGSETTPPCREGVQWLVMTESMGMAKSEIDRFVKAAGNNARPVQARGSRRVTRSAR